jgi:hypothetical protein
MSAAACSGKARFDSMVRAKEVARRAARRHDGDSFEAYRCRVCRGYHVGENVIGRVQRDRPKPRIDEEYA